MLQNFTATFNKQNFTPEQSGDVYDPDTRLKKEAMKKRVEARIAAKKLVSEDLQLKKIISGMQKNVDQYGIEAAKELGLDYGGSVNKGFKVVPAGSNSPNFQEFVDSGKWEEIESQDYRDRTKLNAQNADGTVWFGKTGTDSAGHNATKRYSGNKPWIENPTDKELRQWLIDNNIETLNVAGNRSYGTEELGQQAQETIVKAVQGDTPTSKNTLKIYYPYANKNKTINHANSYKQIVEAQNPGLTVELVDNKSQADMIFGRGQGMGNPFSHESSHSEVIVKTRFFDETMIMYEAWLKGEPMPEGTVPITPEQQKKLDALKAEWDNKLKPFVSNSSFETPKTFEVSTKGDAFGKQFSALNAKFKEGPYAGRTIEDVWQNEIKKSGKRQGPGPGSILEPGNFQQSKDEYQKLWQMWADENPDLISQLKAKVDEGYILKDSWATGDPNKTVNQAEALTNVINKSVNTPTNVVDDVVITQDQFGRDVTIPIDENGNIILYRATDDPNRIIDSDFRPLAKDKGSVGLGQQSYFSPNPMYSHKYQSTGRKNYKFVTQIKPNEILPTDMLVKNYPELVNALNIPEEYTNQTWRQLVNNNKAMIAMGYEAGGKRFFNDNIQTFIDNDIKAFGSVSTGTGGQTYIEYEIIPLVKEGDTLGIKPIATLQTKEGFAAGKSPEAFIETSLDTPTNVVDDIKLTDPPGGSLGAAKINDPNVFDEVIEEYTPGNKFIKEIVGNVPGWIIVPIEQAIESGLRMSGYSSAAALAKKLVQWELYTFAVSLGANAIGRGEGALVSPQLAQAHLILGNEEEFKKRAATMEKDMMQNSAKVGSGMMSAIIKAMPSYWKDEWLLKRNPEFTGWMEMFPDLAYVKTRAEKGVDWGIGKLFGNGK